MSDFEIVAQFEKGSYGRGVVFGKPVVILRKHESIPFAWWVEFDEPPYGLVPKLRIFVARGEEIEPCQKEPKSPSASKK